MAPLEPILDALRSALAAGVIYLAAFGLGRPLLRQLRFGGDNPLSIAVWSLALGLLAAGLLLGLLAQFGWIHPAAIGAISLLGGLWAVIELVCVYLEWTGARVLDLSQPAEPAGRGLPPRPGTRLVFVLAIVVLLASLVAALAPPTSPHALACSLEIPKNLLLGGPVDPLLAGAAAPNIVQLWYLWALALDGPTAASLVHWGLGVLVVLATVLLARRVFDDRRAALLAGALVLLSPGIHQQMSAPLEDLALPLFAALALGAVVEVLLRGDGSRSAAAAGMMLGGALAVSTAAAPLALAIAAAWAWAWLRDGESRGPLARDAAWLALAAGLSGGLAWLALGPRGQLPEPQSLTSAIAHVGPVLVVALGGLVCSRRLRGLDLLLGVLAVYTTLALAGQVQARWWSAAVPLASVAAVWVWQEMGRLPRLARQAAIAAWGALALATSIAGCATAVDSLAVVLGRESRHEFLLARVPPYRAAALVNRISRPDQRVLCQDSRTFYFSCLTANRGGISPGQSGLAMSSSEAEWLARARAVGCTYLLIAQQDAAEAESPQAGRQGSRDRELSPALAGRVPAVGEVIPILEYRFADDNNRYTRYRLVRLR